jgi:hypothetical protein
MARMRASVKERICAGLEFLSETRLPCQCGNASSISAFGTSCRSVYISFFKVSSSLGTRSSSYLESLITSSFRFRAGHGFSFCRWFRYFHPSTYYDPPFAELSRLYPTTFRGALYRSATWAADRDEQTRKTAITDSTMRLLHRLCPDLGKK